MPERISPQLVLVSTAHRAATPLMLGRRAQAMGDLEAPADALLLEWSAAPDVDIADETAWRSSSPHWSAQRHRLMADKLTRAQLGLVVETSSLGEPDPLESFKAQWLNIWPDRTAAISRSEPVLELPAWKRAVDYHAAPYGSLVLGVEDYFGAGAAAGAACRLADGRYLVWGVLTPRRADAWAWVARTAESHARSRVVVGASLAADPAVVELGLPVTTGGLTQTRTALPLMRELLADGRLVHNGSPELAEQVTAGRVHAGAHGLSFVPNNGRSDLLRACAWALAELVQATNKPLPKPAIF